MPEMLHPCDIRTGDQSRVGGNKLARGILGKHRLQRGQPVVLVPFEEKFVPGAQIMRDPSTRENDDQVLAARARIVGQSVDQRPPVLAEVFGFVDPKNGRILRGPSRRCDKRKKFRGEVFRCDVLLTVTGGRDPIAEGSKNRHGRNKFGSDLHRRAALLGIAESGKTSRTRALHGLLQEGKGLSRAASSVIETPVARGNGLADHARFSRPCFAPDFHDGNTPLRRLGRCLREHFLDACERSHPSQWPILRAVGKNITPSVFL